MPDEDSIKLGLDLGSSSESVRALTTEIKFLEERMRIIAQEFRQGTIDEDRFRGAYELLTDTLRDKQQLLKAVGGDEGMGFAGMAGNVRKAEIAINSLVTGQGLNRAGPMLEGVLMSLGGPAGMGLAVGALALAMEKYGPKIAAYFDLFDAEKIKKATEETEKLIEATKKLEALKAGGPEKQFAEMLPGSELTGRVAGAIGVSGLGEQMTPEEQEDIKGLQPLAARGDKASKLNLAEHQKRIGDRIQQANLARAAQLVEAATKPGAAGKAARAQLKGIARQNPGAFPPEFAEIMEGLEETPEEAAKAEAAIEEQDPEQQMMLRRHARRAQFNIRVDERNAARKRAKDLDENMEQLGKDFLAGQKAGQAQLGRGRAIGKAGDEATKARNRELGQLGGEEAKTRRQIEQVAEGQHLSAQLFNQGLVSFEFAQSRVHTQQALLAQLQQRLQRIEQRERELQARQTMLQRGR